MPILPLLTINLGDYDWLNQLNNVNDQVYLLPPHQFNLPPPPRILFPDMPLMARRQTSRQPRSREYMNRPRRNVVTGNSHVSKFSSNKNGFKVNLFVQQFKSDELQLKVVDGFLMVDGKHKENSDERSFISMQLTGRYKIPDDVDQEKLSSRLSSDGVLSISAPKIDKTGGRKISIVVTNQPAVQQTSQNNQDQKEKKKTQES